MAQPKHILVLTYWSFRDALVQTYTLPYLRIIRDILPEGSVITLVTLEPDGEIQQEEKIEDGIVKFSFRSRRFGIRAAIGWLSNMRAMRNMIREKKTSFIHTWCTPAGAIGYKLSVRTGVPLILDSFEPHAEPMVETGTWKKGGPAFRTLFRAEKKQVFHAQWIIGVVAAMKEYARHTYGFTGENFLVKPACIDTQHFNPGKRKDPEILSKLMLTDEIICVYAGKFGGLYMRGEAFRFFRIAREVFGEKFKVLLLSSTPQSEVTALCEEAGLPRNAVLCMYVAHEEVPNYMGLGDFAFSAFKPVASRKYCTPIKNGEYWAMGLPVVIAEGISEDSDIIRETNSGYVLRSLDAEEFRKASEHIRNMLNSEDRVNLAARIHGLAQKHRNFAIAQEVYRKIYSA